MSKSNQADKTLNLYPIDYPFETLSSRIRANPPKLKLDPDFQRKYKWDKEGWERASRFIESCLMRIPLPACYFAEKEDGTHLVIDGVQRLTTIEKFFNNEFSLEGLTSFEELEGKKFSELGGYRAELEATTIRCIILRKENPEYLIQEIFSRLNQGAVKLSDQEIRHAIYPGSLNDLLLELAKTSAIANFGNTTKDSREGEELVLRFFALQDDLAGYEGRLSRFLDSYMRENAKAPEVKLRKLRGSFISTLGICHQIFGETVFTDTTKDRPLQSIVHYDLLMNSLYKYKKSKIIGKEAKIQQAFEELCKNSEFQRTLSGGIQNKVSILKRRELWEKLLKPIMV
ncbi:DUF262 domain-containing protein [Simplicispira metamorpha]|uniref:Uncharacterized protein DUF262 n=1 Tax=Simplicispira metamorpha TaxID=80881 RepID=A0A4R2N771_9BURK|nr:DUF262 domain-containing protein [Simplicispira metamorpha]TCP16783.1 uncharacterized protein DUF262 [Simplicispira metamorpha]